MIEIYFLFGFLHIQCHYTHLVQTEELLRAHAGGEARLLRLLPHLLLPLPLLLIIVLVGCVHALFDEVEHFPAEQLWWHGTTGPEDAGTISPPPVCCYQSKNLLKIVAWLCLEMVQMGTGEWEVGVGSRRRTHQELELNR